MPLSRLPLLARQELEQETRSAFEAMSDAESPRKRCLHWAIAAEQAFADRGYRACINAGTANWRANHDPEPAPTHVGHFWQNLSDMNIYSMFLSRGILPEMHCWLALPDEGVIFDPTTAWLKDLADENGIPWTEPEPPAALWCDIDTLPEGWMYVADRRATMLAYQLAESIRLFGTIGTNPRSIAVLS